MNNMFNNAYIIAVFLGLFQFSKSHTIIFSFKYLPSVEKQAERLAMGDYSINEF